MTRDGSEMHALQPNILIYVRDLMLYFKCMHSFPIMK